MATGTPLERYEMKIDRSGGPDACHPWTAALTHGYGAFRAAPGVTMGAHRFGYLEHVGPIPAGLDVDHTCHNADPLCMGGDACPHRACQNPRHWEAVPPGLNTSRGKAGVVNRARMTRTTCARAGHSLDLIDKRGRKSCSRCQRERARARYRPRTSCKYGHPYPETATTPGKHRHCQVC